MYTINNDAYSFELIQNSEELFDSDIISATYIIHLEGNGRLENIKTQLNKYNTSKQVFILHNQGYKKSKKQDYINKPALDLVDAFLTIFKHAINNNFHNILIFEDDFICDKKLLDKNITNDICQFIKSKNNEQFLYYLGLLPLILSKTESKNHYKCISSIGTHAAIYSCNFMNYTLNYNQESIVDWDLYNNLSSLNKINRYLYKDCLCYQVFTVTENQNNWGKITNNKIINNLIQNLYVKHIINGIMFIELDSEKDIDKKFDLFYKLCKLLH
jgi:hypothetical protein